LIKEKNWSFFLKSDLSYTTQKRGEKTKEGERELPNQGKTEKDLSRPRGGGVWMLKQKGGHARLRV
jgi:hypothetical protein